MGKYVNVETDGRNDSRGFGLSTNKGLAWPVISGMAIAPTYGYTV